MRGVVDGIEREIIYMLIDLYIYMCVCERE